MVYLTLLFAVTLASFSVIYRQRRSLELACLISSFFYCSYFFVEQFLSGQHLEIVLWIAMLDALWLFSLWVVRAPYVATALCAVDFLAGLVLLIWPGLFGQYSAAFALLVNVAFVGSLTLAPLVHNLKPEGYQAQ